MLDELVIFLSTSTMAASLVAVVAAWLSRVRDRRKVIRDNEIHVEIDGKRYVLNSALPVESQIEEFTRLVRDAQLPSEPEVTDPAP